MILNYTILDLFLSMVQILMIISCYNKQSEMVKIFRLFIKLNLFYPLDFNMDNVGIWENFLLVEVLIIYVVKMLSMYFQRRLRDILMKNHKQHLKKIGWNNGLMIIFQLFKNIIKQMSWLFIVSQKNLEV